MFPRFFHWSLGESSDRIPWPSKDHKMKKKSYSQVIHTLRVDVASTALRLKTSHPLLKKKVIKTGRKSFNCYKENLDSSVEGLFIAFLLTGEVLGEGLEPTLLAEPDPKSGASANFATRAFE